MSVPKTHFLQHRSDSVSYSFCNHIVQNSIFSFSLQYFLITNYKYIILLLICYIVFLYITNPLCKSAIFSLHVTDDFSLVCRFSQSRARAICTMYFLGGLFKPFTIDAIKIETSIKNRACQHQHSIGFQAKSFH